MVSYDTDEEQIEAIKNWWKENGSQLMVSLAVVLAGTFGFQTWQSSVQEKGESASALYEDLRAAISSPGEISASQITTARYLADTLIKDHESSIYSNFAALHMAKLSLEQGELDQAEKDLQWVVEQDDEAIKPLARLRMARIVLAKGELERALAMVEEGNDAAYQSSYAELRGDIYLQMGRSDDARQAYQTALSELQPSESNPLIQMKLDDIVAPSGQANRVDAVDEQEQGQQEQSPSAEIQQEE